MKQGRLPAPENMHTSGYLIPTLVVGIGIKCPMVSLQV